MNADGRRESDAAAEMALNRLATYGSLAPGRPNHHQLDGLEGRWLGGQVHGTLVDAGWGASLGYPALILDPDSTSIDVQVFESLDLPAHWSRLDAFEGPGYRRVVTNVSMPAGDIDASIYVLRVRTSAEPVPIGRRPTRPPVSPERQPLAQW